MTKNTINVGDTVTVDADYYVRDFAGVTGEVVALDQDYLTIESDDIDGEFEVIPECVTVQPYYDEDATREER